MCARPGDADFVPADPLDAVDDAGLAAAVLEAASLLDVEFEVGAQWIEAVVGVVWT